MRGGWTDRAIGALRCRRLRKRSGIKGKPAKRRCAPLTPDRFRKKGNEALQWQAAGPGDQTNGSITAGEARWGGGKFEDLGEKIEGKKNTGQKRPITSSHNRQACPTLGSFACV